MTMLTIAATDGSGTYEAYVAMPSLTPAATIIVIQEIFGVNIDMRQKCDNFAKQGYIAICPDLFWRQKPNVQLSDKTDAEWQQAFALLQGFNLDFGIADLNATLKVARSLPETNGRVGCVGFCLGGKLAYLMASRTDIDASVSYYGIGLDALLSEASHISNPLILHVAELDKYVPADARELLLNHFENHPNVKAYLYKGVDHAFSRFNGSHYNAAAATLAHSRTDQFFKEHLKA